MRLSAHSKLQHPINIPGASASKTTTQQPIKKEFNLLETLKDKNTAISFDCMEGLPHPTVKEAPKVEKSFVRDRLPIIGYVTASLGHFIAGIGKLSNAIPTPVTDFLDQHSLKFSKLVNIANYTYKGIESLKANRAWDGISRLVYTAVVPWVPLESVFTWSGLSSGPTMLEQAQRHKIIYPNATEKSNGKPTSILEDLRENGKAFKTMFKETFSPKGLWGKDRKIFLSIKEEEKGGHTMFFSAWGNIIGAIAGMFAGSNHSGFLGRFAAITRNAGGIGCDWAKLIHPDLNNKLSAIFYGAVSLFDVTKSFTNENTSHVLSHFSMGMNNFANFFYVNTSKATVDDTFEDYKPNYALNA